MIPLMKLIKPIVKPSLWPPNTISIEYNLKAKQTYCSSVSHVDVSSSKKHTHLSLFIFWTHSLVLNEWINSNVLLLGSRHSRTFLVLKVFLISRGQVQCFHIRLYAVNPLYKTWQLRALSHEWFTHCHMQLFSTSICLFLYGLILRWMQPTIIYYL